MLGNGEDDAFDPIPAVHTGPAANEPTRKKPTYLIMGQEDLNTPKFNKYLHPDDPPGYPSDGDLPAALQALMSTASYTFSPNSYRTHMQ
ncbi:hypothetical protein PAL_GLEAN10007473 [Pteropus alecto]|uniref:Uncharacterized protein n=1 Tax=Pteropus alecto TaxID=9402 RepID=L5L4R8_PTEAL|nr:hypothetical protein PAL_GLEAN10007473 [Pteropus alecto]